MKRKLYSVFLAALMGMTGTQVWAQGLTTTEIDGATYYEIKSGEDLIAFANLVNGDAEAGTPGERNANAVLTADIDLTGLISEETPWTPIGTGVGAEEPNVTAFTGVFDGQGHTISGFEVISYGHNGLFGDTKEATIKNFTIKGKMIVEEGYGSGVVGWPNASNIIGVHSYLDIDVTQGGVHHIGGVVGSARYSNVISGCTYHGTMNVAAGSTDNFAGIVAYLGSDSVSFCANYGTINFDDVSCAAGGVAGYCNNNVSWVQNCLNMGSVVLTEPEGTPTYGGAIVGRLRTHDLSKMTGNCWLEGSATGAGKDGGNANLTTANCIKLEQMPTGEVCYLLNGDQSTIGWYQTLGTDEAPVLFDATHGQVYMNGRLHCNGDIYVGAVFSNENTGITQDEHNIVDGFCDYCALFDPTYMAPNADGFYEIGSARQLAWFEKAVNTLGKDSINAVLTADIDFEDITALHWDWTPIGNWGTVDGRSIGYHGTFDGQGHVITNFNFNGTQNYFGLFGVLTEGAVVGNFDIYGEVTNSFKTMGVVGYTRDTETTVHDIHSFLNINNTADGNRYGGIIGSAVNGTTNVLNCTYSGTLDGHDSAGNGNYGGIVGYVNNNSAAIVNITNCLFDGEVINTAATPGGCTFGGFVGYSNSGIVTIKNSLSIGKVESAVYGQFFGAVKSTRSSLPNSYYIGDIINGSASTVELTATETDMTTLAGGEITWALNEENFIDVVWHQVLDEQLYPVPYGTQGIVYQASNGSYECIDVNPDSFSGFLNDIITKETEFLETVGPAYQELLTAYKAAIESWEDIDNLEAFLEAYKASAELKESIKTSAANYALYVQACEAAATYVSENNLQGETTDILTTYLESNVEPNAEEYPNGSYPYIMDNLNLDDEAIANEIIFVNQMLEAAVAADGILPGNEITRLLANPNFTEGEDNFDGWKKEAGDGTSFATGGVQEVMNIARGKGNDFYVQQTLSNLPNGIYMMALNGLFLPGNDIYSKFYAGQLYLNGTYNYMMVPGEDVIATDDAEDEVNCLLSDDDEYLDDVEGYVPSTFKGCSYAFNAGRYQNYVAAEVTDGTLTVGMRNLATGIGDDWMPFGNLHLIYLGSAAEADADGKLSDVLDGYKSRAEIILDFETSNDPSDFYKYPNMSEELKEQLSIAVNLVDQTQDKMALIKIFSDLFNKVYDSRKAYIAMLDAANKLSDIIGSLDAIGMISDKDYEYWDEEIQNAQNAYDEGEVSTEQALAIAEKLRNSDFMIQPVDGVYQLANATDVVLFSLIVNSGEGNVKAVMTNDIDMSEIESYEPVGNSSNPFKGEFDGQNYKVTGFNQESGNDAFGFIGYASGATIKNFSIEGSITYSTGTGVGAIGWATGTAVSNVHSSLDIAVVATAHHVGGVIGHLSENSSATNCSFSGTIYEAGGTHDCIGGIGAYSNNGVSYTNCANYGTIIYNTANAYAGGICGYVNNDSFKGVFNCLNVGKVEMENGTASYGGAFVGRLRSHANSQFLNNYMLLGSTTNASGENNITVTTVNDKQLMSGEVCYKLNGDQSEINWYQTINEDQYPLLFPDHEIVYYDETEGFYYNLINGIPVGINEIASSEPKVQTGIYNLAGQRLEKLQKGINIVNGKKVLVK